MSRHSVVVLLGVCLILTGCAGGSPGPDGSPTGATTSAAPSTGTLPDFDGDGAADVVAGIGEDAGRVAVVYASGRTQDLRRADLDDTESISFGRALIARDLDGDGITDLVVGDPGPDVTPAVFLVRGSTSGLDTGEAHRLTAPTGVAAFGQALALVDQPQRMLAVGAPGDGSGPALGGAVAMWALDAQGLPNGEPQVVTQGSPGMSGGARAGDAFGATLAATGSWLAIGAPRKDLPGLRDAGEVTLVDQSADPAGVTALVQGIEGVPGEAATEDRFGFALAAGDGHLAVGVPMDDEDGRDAGLVQVFRLDASGPVALDPLRAGALGAPNAAGSLFGFSVALARPCPGTPGLVIGAPATSVGEAGNSGAAWLVPIADADCPIRELTEGGALGGAPVEIASVGSAVSALTGSDAQADTVVLTAPGNDEEGVPGRVLTLAPPFTGPAAEVLGGLRLHEEGTITLGPAVR